jgi:tetratricopeptide (TPR) repeat protein
MYYRYKVHKKEKRGLRRLIVIVLVALCCYLIYTQRQFLFFWQYTTNKLIKKVDSARAMQERASRIEALKKISESLNSYQNESPADVTPFLLAGRVYYYLGEEELGESFTDLFIKEQHTKISARARYYFLRSIVNIRKAMALLDGEKISPEYAMILARGCFYTDFVDAERLLAIFNEYESDRAAFMKKPADARFYSVILIINKREKEGLKILAEHGRVDDAARGILFLAALEALAKQYTSAITHYQGILSTATDPAVLKIVHVNLGKIYFNQSLYRESLHHFGCVLDIDGADIVSKIWSGRNYHALGQKARARALWNEVLSADKENDEVKKLLGII